MTTTDDPKPKAPSPAEGAPAPDAAQTEGALTPDAEGALAPDAAPAPEPGGKGPQQKPGEIGGPRGPEPTRYGDWEFKGRCSDF